MDSCFGKFLYHVKIIISMVKKLILPIILLLFPFFSEVKEAPVDVVRNFGEVLATWCRTGDITNRENLEQLCNGVRIYDGVRCFCNGLARFEVDKKFGFLDKNGKVVIPAVYDLAMFFHNGYVCVGKKTMGE